MDVVLLLKYLHAFQKSGCHPELGGNYICDCLLSISNKIS